MAIFNGAGVAIVTPMKANGDVDYESFGKLIDYQISNGTDAIIVCGTTGEASTLSHEEHLDCIRFTVEQTKKRIPVIAGTGSNSTDTAIYLSKEAEKYGVDGILVVTPYYNKATQNGLKQHFTKIANSVDVPMIMYNIPGRTGCSLAVNTIASLLKEVDNIVAVKEATGNISFVAELMSATNGDIDVYSGNDDQVVPILSLGGKGVISVLSNILPQETHDMVALFQKGDVEASRNLQVKYIPLINALFCEVNPIPVKKALERMGMIGGTLRLPLTEMEPQNEKKLVETMIQAGITVR